MPVVVKIGSLSLEAGKPTVAGVWHDRVSGARVKALKGSFELLEVRADLCASVQPERLLSMVPRLAHVPRLLTIRSAAEGGSWKAAERGRLALFQELIPSMDAVDIELSSHSILPKVIMRAKKTRRTVLVSFHDFKGTPTKRRLQAILGSARSAGADLVKIAAQVHGPEDVNRLAGFLCENAGEPLVVIGMGREGVATRLLFPALGSLLTYASLEKPTAPGQLDCLSTRRLLHFLYPAHGTGTRA